MNPAYREAVAAHVLADAPDFEIREGHYVVRYARTADELQRALELRYRIFNLELGEGLEESHLTGRDEDGFDAGCHHLITEDTRDGTVIGTYRLQTCEMALKRRGFYSDGEFELSGLGVDVLSESIELGRACIDAEHRNQRVLFGLWKGLAATMLAFDSRYLFGCCSITSQDPAVGLATDRWLRQEGFMRGDLRVKARPSHACEGPEPTAEQVRAVSLPKLFSTYLRFGSLACSEPAIDREFGTVDFLVITDRDNLPEKVLQLFFSESM